jgi:hypothetical protein
MEGEEKLNSTDRVKKFQTGSINIKSWNITSVTSLQEKLNSPAKNKTLQSALGNSEHRLSSKLSTCPPHSCQSSLNFVTPTGSQFLVGVSKREVCNLGWVNSHY